MIRQTLKDIILKSSEYLKNKGIENPRLDTELLLSNLLDISRLDLYLQFDRILTDNEIELLRKAVTERGKRKPLQYIIGKVHFLNAVISVNENVLIPRPETEFMIDFILKNEDRVESVLDLCTGSGVIAISIKQSKTECQVFASDISDLALEVAKENAKLNNCSIEFIHSNIFEKIDREFDLIVCNPPYISEKDYLNLQPELFYEPKNALVAEDEGLKFYKEIMQNAKKFMTDKGKIYFEIGYKQSESILSLATLYEFKECKIIKDLSGFDRIAILEV